MSLMPEPSTAGGMLGATLSRVLGLGTPGAHLSVRATGIAIDSCAGLAQAFGDTGPVRRQMTSDTWHDLGSVTKVAATTAALMTLVAARELDLDGAVRAVLPEFSHDATVRDLLQHRAGLWEWWPTYLTCEEPAAAIGLLARLPLRYPPRTGRHYSDLDFMLLGEILRRVSGENLPRAAAEWVFAPLGITGFRFGVPPAGLPVAASSCGDAIEREMIRTGEPYPVLVDAAGFDRWRTRVLVGEVNDGNAFHAFGGAAGHAGLFGTAAALHALGRALIESAAGGHWPAVTLAEFWAPGPDSGQLLGFRSWSSTVGTCVADVIGHTGFPGVGLGMLRAHHATVVLATNRLHVAGPPAPFDPMWRAAMDAAHVAIHRLESET